MSLKNWLYYLLEEDGRSVYVQDGIISSRGTPTPLPNSPDGWSDLLVAWERNQQKHGIVRNFTKEMSFVLDGATILRHSQYTFNIDRKLYMLIQQLALEYTTTYKWIYEYFYKGELDFSTMKDMQDMVKIQIMEGGLSKLLKAHESTVYSIPLDVDAVSVVMDGIILKEKGNFIFLDGLEINKSETGQFFFLPIAFTGREGQSSGIAFSEQTMQAVGGLSWGDKLALTNCIATAAPNNLNTLSVPIEGVAKVNCNTNDTGNGLRIRFLRSNLDIADQDDYLVVDTPLVEGESYEFPISLTIPLQPGERLFVEGIYTGVTGGVEVTISFNPESTLTLNYENRYKTTIIKAFLRKTLWKKLCEKAFGHQDYGLSDLFENDNRVITCGDAIRGIAGAEIKTTINDFFKDADTDLMAGMGIEIGPATANLPAGQRIRIEERARYYDASAPIALGEPKKRPEISFAADLAFNKIKVGWQKPEIEDVNGKYDFNGSQQYTTPIQRISRELDLLSPYKAGPYEIEITRLNLEGKTTTDNDNDNDVFVLVVGDVQGDETATVSFNAALNAMFAPNGIDFAAGQRIRITGSVSNDGTYDILSVGSFLFGQIVILDGTLVDELDVSVLIEFVNGPSYRLKRDTWDNQGDPDDFGVPSPTTIFNIDLSPKRKLLRHSRWLRSILHNYDTEKIKFQSGDKNTDLKTVQGSVTIAENADANVEDLGDKLFIPFYFDFETKVPIDLVDTLEASTNRCFSFTWEGETYNGFLFKAGLAPNTLEEQQYKLLAAPDTDMTNFITD